MYGPRLPRRRTPAVAASRAARTLAMRSPDRRASGDHGPPWLAIVPPRHHPGEPSARTWCRSPAYHRFAGGVRTPGQGGGMARVEPRVDAGIGAEGAPVDGDTPVGHDGPGVDPVRDGVRTWNVVRDAAARAVVGADAPLRLLLVALLADGPALIEDVP